MKGTHISRKAQKKLSSTDKDSIKQLCRMIDLAKAHPTDRFLVLRGLSAQSQLRRILS